jgi:hypothetical protein
MQTVAGNGDANSCRQRRCKDFDEKPNPPADRTNPAQTTLDRKEIVVQHHDLCF